MPAESPVHDAFVVSSVPVNLAILACLAVLAIVDLRTRRVPQIVTMPLLAILGVWRLGRGDWIVLACWAAAFMLYAFHICNAGDVKVIMVELAVWPSIPFVVVLGVSVAVLGAVVSVARFRGVGPFLRSMQVAGGRLLSGRPPTQAELQAQGLPQVFLYVAGAALYLVMFYGLRHAAWGGAGG